LSDIDRLLIAEDYLEEWRWERIGPDGRHLAGCAYPFDSYRACVESAVRLNAQPYRLETSRQPLPLADELDIREDP
jgi:hypothetical protein